MPKINKIYGAPGTGKTTRLIKIITSVGLPLNKISYVTFSKRAMQDMWKRMEREGATDSDLEWFRTIHAMNYRLLGIRKEQVVTASKLAEFCKEKKFTFTSNLVPEDDINYIDRKMFGNELSLDDEFYIQMQKDRTEMRPFSYVHPKLRAFSGTYLHFKHAYFDWLRENDYIDYIGMIEQGIERGVCPPVEMLCVDEWQDLDPLKIKQIMIWASQIPISYHVGDDDQTIYTFSGADPTAFLKLESDNEEVLHETFRLPQDILALSQEIIKRNTKRKDKNIHSKKDIGGIFLKSIASVSEMLKELPKHETVFLLVRNNFVIKNVTRDFIDHGIPIVGLQNERKALRLMLENKRKKFFLPEDIETLCLGSIFPANRYFTRGAKKKLKKLLERPFPDIGYSIPDMISFGVKPDFFKDLQLGNVANLNIDGETMTYLLRLFKQYGFDFQTVKIMTIHASKGLEADTVILVPDITKVCAENENAANYDLDLVESERRVWYTAITRAKKRLIMLDRTDYSPYKTRTQNILAVYIEKHKNTPLI